MAKLQIGTAKHAADCATSRDTILSMDVGDKEAKLAQDLINALDPNDALPGNGILERKATITVSVHGIPIKIAGYLFMRVKQ